METISLTTLSAQTKKIFLTSGKTYTFIIHQSEITILEIEDMVFRTNSAMFMPDIFEDPDTAESNEKQVRVQGIDMLKMVMMYAFQNKDTTKRLLCCGHADPSHTDEYNRTLSGYRSAATISLIAGKREIWVDLFKSQKKNSVSTFRNEDIQQLLIWVAARRKWNCLPGKIDGIIGNKTTTAIKNFQKAYSLDGSFSKIKDDGVIGEETCGAFFDILADDLKKEVEKQLKKMYPESPPTFESVRDSINLYDQGGDPLKSCTSCGEAYPIEECQKKDYRSLKSRRVECMFIDENDEIELNCIGGPCVKENCPIYKKNGNGKHKIPRVYISPKDAYGNYINLKIADYLNDESLDGCPYTLQWGQGATDQISDSIIGGKIEAVLPEGQKSADLTVWSNNSKETVAFTLSIVIEMLDPIESNKGVQQRLNNLGFDCGPVDGEFGEATEEAIRHFQFYAKIEINGNADATTRAKLYEIYGS